MISAPLIEYLKKGIFTLLGSILAVYLFVILMTYTGNDPSWSHISSDMTTINNMGGETGAWLSDLLYSFFGFGAWWLLAFLIYESILIWWDNKPTFWLMRLVAYVFLLLSASALFAQIVALVQQFTNPTATALEGVAGGIIGLELQVRLAQLLTQWGSAIFLLVFVVLTATFAFNIHWMAIYQRITALSWFGSGVRKENTQDTAAVTQNTGALNTKAKLTTESNSDQEAPAYEQLPLALQSSDQGTDKSGRFSNVLSDFLVKSGLSDSVRASMAAAAQATTATQTPLSDHEKSESVEAKSFKNGTTENIDSQTQSSLNPSPVVVPVRKVEPSFAWNDANTVDDLLASEQMTYSASSMNHSDTTALSSTDISAEPIKSEALKNEFVKDEPTELEVTAQSMPITPIVEEALSVDTTVRPKTRIIQPSAEEQLYSETASTDAVVSTAEDTTVAVDALADAWLAEHADVLEPTATTEIVQSNELVTDSQTELSNPATSTAISALSVASPVLDSIAAVSESVDMTPTNTPPTNPTAAPTVATIDTDAAKNTQPVKPTMSFAVPEGDSSNHITDMMPEDDDAEAPVMPHISDDDAFSRKSRSMQTAAYRSSLTPIPEMSILDKPDPDRKPSYTIAELEQLSELLEIKLQEFNVKANVVNAIPGPVVTRFEVELAAGVKASKVTGISRDLARSLSMASLRVVEVIPGKPYIGIEVPNKQREMVRLIELLNTEKFKDPKAQISMAMGKDIGGNPIITDLARAPHMLVAGTTGSGKSVLVNSMLLSMLLKYTPNELRLILIDPKQLELANYNDIPHLLTPVVTDMTEAASSLSWCVAEMERRYQLMSLLKVRKLNEFNKKVIAAEKAGKPMLDPLWRPNDSVSISQAPKLKTLPMIVIVADEFADMIMQVGKQAEELITRLAQKSRAAGIHLMLATQRPSVDVITGLIKANIPVRAALRVNSKVDSRTILDSGGAEDMLGNGDMLFLGPGQIEPDRVHGAYVSDEEVNRVCDAWRERGAPDYIDNMAGNFELSSPGGNGGGSANNASGEDDGLYNDAVAFIMETRKVSASSIQRKFSIGYNRAARIVDSMEEAGLVSSMGKSGKRELLM
ncbi:DNA translocase FtsK 4TM domain-containing protein [Psychrobacter alimentarius]|uniref:DNA translocase FtsK 4TM domain-containing protein n=1 Tax=Psychrobacter alimentarius TaxID=261164 RepID=UPI003FD3EED0